MNLVNTQYEKDQLSLTFPNGDHLAIDIDLNAADAMSQLMRQLQDNGAIAPKWLIETQHGHWEQLRESGASNKQIEAELLGTSANIWGLTQATAGSDPNWLARHCANDVSWRLVA